MKLNFKACIANFCLLVLALMVLPAVASAWPENITYPGPGVKLQTIGNVGSCLAPGRSDEGKSASLSNNRVVLAHPGVVNRIYGAYNDIDNETADCNTVVINGGIVMFHVWGALSNGDARLNSVTVNGGLVLGNIYGGYSNQGSAMENRVEINDKAVLGEESRIYGGNVKTGNLLWLGSIIKVRTVSNFAAWDFSIPSSFKKGGAILTVTDAVDLTGAILDIVFLNPEAGLIPGDQVILISSAGGIIGVPKTVRDTPYAPNKEINTSAGRWKFNITDGKLIATLAGSPYDNGGCNAGYGLFAVALASVLAVCGRRAIGKP